VQRFFSTFPHGSPGIGLLILRAFVGMAAAIQGIRVLAQGADGTLPAVAIAIAAIAGGAAVLVGFLTPASSALSGAAALSLALGPTPSSLPAIEIDMMATTFVVADAAALVLLGPGAYSLDARLFGRREVVIPNRR
jgi:uncharacterized membrane protein YphA (DoxX/SURF4 family)